MKHLSQSEIIAAQAIIDVLPPGSYELSQLYGQRWTSIISPTTFGTKFKATVLAGLLVNIAIGDRKSNNHHTYDVLG